MRNRRRRGEGEDFARKNTEARRPSWGEGVGRTGTPNVAASQASASSLQANFNYCRWNHQKTRVLFKILNAGKKGRGKKSVARRWTMHSLKPPPLAHCLAPLPALALFSSLQSFVFVLRLLFLAHRPIVLYSLRSFCHLAGFSGYWFRFEQLFPFL